MALKSCVVDIVLGSKLKDRSAPYTGISFDDVVELVMEKDPLKTTPTTKNIKKALLSAVEEQLIGYGKNSRHFLKVIPNADHIGPFFDPSSLEPHFRGKGFKSIKKLSLSGVVSDDDTDDEEDASPSKKKKSVSAKKSAKSPPSSVKKSAKKTVTKMTKVTPKRSSPSAKAKKSTPKSSAKGKGKAAKSKSTPKSSAKAKGKGKAKKTPKAKKAAAQDETDEEDEELMELGVDDEGDVVGEDLDSALVAAA